MKDPLPWYGLAVLAMFLAAAASWPLANYVGSAFGFGEQGTEYIMAGFFFLFPTVIALTYERWWRWQFFKPVVGREAQPRDKFAFPKRAVTLLRWKREHKFAYGVVCTLAGIVIAALIAYVAYFKSDSFDECMVREMRGQSRIMYSHVGTVCSRRFDR